MLRLIAGEFKGRRLRTVASSATRPMTDRVRESLFSILAPELPGSRFLDLFAGSGAVGIEALSRGAAEALLVESDPESFAVICDNLSSLGLTSRGLPMRADDYRTVDSLGESGQRFDVVFAGPPYDEDHHNRIAERVAEAGICRDGGVVVLQYRRSDPLQPPPGWSAETRGYGITSLSLLRRDDA